MRLPQACHEADQAGLSAPTPRAPINSPSVARLEAMLADALLGSDEKLVKTLRTALWTAMDREAFVRGTIDTSRPFVLEWGMPTAYDSSGLQSGQAPTNQGEPTWPLFLKHPPKHPSV